jgi:hypothetical protein
MTDPHANERSPLDFTDQPAFGFLSPPAAILSSHA